MLHFRKGPLRLLAEHGAVIDREVSPTDRCTALHRAARNLSLKSAEVLMAHGADVNRPDETGKTPLFCAIEGHYYGFDTSHRLTSEQCVDLLLAHGADIHARLTNGETPLMLAAEERNEPALRRLLARGAEVDARDTNGQTALR